jgi:transcriptional regulator with XRE-family HTH domain
MTENSYKNWTAMSDKVLLKHIGDFIKYHRMEQNKTQDTLATEAGISRSTLSLLERGESVTLLTLIQVLRMLDQLQVMDTFRIEKQISPIQLARMEQKKRKRVREKKKDNQPESNW